MANLKISLRKKGASSFEGGDKLLPETDWAYILNKPPTFVPDPHEHPIEEIEGLRSELDGKAASVHPHTFASLTSKPTTLSGYGITDAIVLGETASTAYPGNKGKIAYDHSLDAHAPSNAQKNSDITKAEIEAKLTGTITKHTHSASAIVEDASHRFVTDSEKDTWSSKENAITKGTTAQYFRGDMSLATFPTIPTIPSIMTQADINSGTATRRTINASLLKANFYNKTEIDDNFIRSDGNVGAEESVFLGTSNDYSFVNLYLGKKQNGSHIMYLGGEDNLADMYLTLNLGEGAVVQDNKILYNDSVVNKKYVDGLIGSVYRPSGNWNASTNVPALANNTPANAGKVYRVSVAGTRFGFTFAVGDKLTFNESGVISKWDNVDDVTSVAGKTGTVVLTASDVGARPAGNVPWTEVSGKPSFATVATSGSYADLSNKPSIPSAQVQSDWNATSGMGVIKNKPALKTVATSGSYNDLSNKPTIPAAQAAVNWNSTSGITAILNKPSLATVATSGSYADLTGKPSIPAAQVQSNWNSTSGITAILNKPSLATVATSGSYNDLSNKPTIPTIPSIMTQADINSGTATRRTINASLLKANFYNKTEIDDNFIRSDGNVGAEENVFLGTTNDYSFVNTYLGKKRNGSHIMSLNGEDEIASIYLPLYLGEGALVPDNKILYNDSVVNKKYTDGKAYKKVLAKTGTLIFDLSGSQYINIDSQYWNYTNLKLVIRIVGGSLPEIVYQTYDNIDIMPMSYTGADNGAGPAVAHMNVQRANQRIQVHAMNAIQEIQYWVYAENYQV